MVSSQGVSIPASGTSESEYRSSGYLSTIVDTVYYVCVCLMQEGHSRAAYNIEFHPDGSLAGTWYVLLDQV